MQCREIPLIARFCLFVVASLLLFPAVTQAVSDAETALFYAEIQKKFEQIEEVSEVSGMSLTDLSKQYSTQLAKPTLPSGPSPGSITLRDIHTTGITLSILAFLLCAALIGVSLRLTSNYAKKIIFTAIVIMVGFSSMFLIASAMYIGSSSDFEGVVDRYADFAIYACGDELPPPFLNSLLSNKAGSSFLHEHGDRRMHVSGVLGEAKDASFERFINAQGGNVNDNSFLVPTLDGFREFRNGDLCPDGKPAEWNAFVYKVNPTTHTIWKEKLEFFSSYTPSPYRDTPPGDCLILDFSPRHTDTSYICEAHKAAIEGGALTPLWTQ